MYLANKKGITAFKSYKLIEVEKNIENISWKFASFQITKCDVTFPLQQKVSLQMRANTKRRGFQSIGKNQVFHLWCNHVNYLTQDILK